MGHVVLVDGGTCCKCKANQMHQARIVKAFWFDFISFETFLLRARPHQTKSYSSMSCIGIFSCSADDGRRWTIFAL